jgi:predicted protein tyrosine phosphatase
MENDPILKEKILHKAGWMAREAVKQAIDDFVASHPEYEEELIHATIPAKRETTTTIPIVSSPAIERELENGVN